jgi:hypothetical protein
VESAFVPGLAGAATSDGRQRRQPRLVALDGLGHRPEDALPQAGVGLIARKHPLVGGQLGLDALDLVLDRGRRVVEGARVVRRLELVQQAQGVERGQLQKFSLGHWFA